MNCEVLNYFPYRKCGQGKEIQCGGGSPTYNINMFVPPSLTYTVALVCRGSSIYFQFQLLLTMVLNSCFRIKSAVALTTLNMLYSVVNLM